MNAQGPLAIKQYAEPISGHVSLGKPLRTIIFLVPMLLAVVIIWNGVKDTPRGMLNVKPLATLAGAVLVMWFIATGVRVAAQWERGVVLRLGRFSSIKGPGLMFIIPIIDYVRFVDLRILALNIPSQKVITKDNVPASIDGVLFFMVADPERAVIKIQEYQFAISQYAQASLRDVVGQLSLDEVLTERQQIQERIGAAIEDRIREWGLHVDSIRLLDIEMPEDLKRTMSRQASAEREKRATITKAEGDKLAAVNLAQAAATMATSPGAMQLRALQTIDGLGASPSNTVIMFPVELSQALQTFKLLKPTAPPENPPTA